jgi:lysophospholipase L1-like esterase
MLNETAKPTSNSRRSLTLLLLLSVCSATALCDTTRQRTREADCVPCMLARQKIEDADGRALAHFHRALARSLQGSNEAEAPAVTRILHYGDSHIAADWLTGVVREQLQQAFGDSGPGFLLAGRPWHSYTRSGANSGATAGWRTDGLGLATLATDGRFGLAGVSLSTEKVGERAWLTAQGHSFEFYLLQHPRGGAIEIWLDGRLAQPALSLAAPQIGSLFVIVTAAQDGPHRLELRTIAPGAVRLCGIVAERQAAGVTYDTLGINGARTTRLLALDWQVLAEQLQEHSPDLIIISYGSNEAGDTMLDLAQYRAQFSELLQRFQQAAPQASLLVTAPPDRAARSGGRWQSLRVLPTLIAAQRQAALTAGAAFWNLFQAMGGAGSINHWAARATPLAQSDHVHLTRAGYKLVGEALYNELLRSYLNSELPELK